MRKLCLLLYFSFPFLCFGQSEVAPEGYGLVVLLGLLVGVPLFLWLLAKAGKGRMFGSLNRHSRGQVDVWLTKDRKYRPKVLTLRVENRTKKAVDLNGPVLMIRRLWSVRRFKLKGVNGARIYPLYLEAGKTHELQLQLNAFYQHDPSLRSYYWARVGVSDTAGRTYTTKYITLRKSLFS